MITKQAAKQLIIKLNRLASQYSDLITAENNRRQEAQKDSGEPMIEIVYVGFSPEQRNSYSTAIRELELIRQERPNADAQRAQGAFDAAQDALSAGIAGLTPQEGAQ